MAYKEINVCLSKLFKLKSQAYIGIQQRKKTVNTDERTTRHSRSPVNANLPEWILYSDQLLVASPQLNKTPPQEYLLPTNCQL